ncbi:sensor domain-containing protein [Streptomyces albidoflavus]
MPRPAVREALRRPSRFLLSAWPLRCWLHLLGGVLSGAVVLAVLVVAVSLGVVLSVIGVGLLILVAVPLLGLPVAAVERRRLRLVEPARLPAARTARRRWPVAVAAPPVRGACHLARTRVRGTRSTAFTCAGLGVLALTALAAILVPTPVVVWALAPETVMVIPGEAVGSPLAALPFTALGAAGLVLAAYAAGWLTTAQVRTAWFLLAPRDDGMTRRVHELTRSRVRLADAFEAERRRIERDLHDGAQQQQLVALTMTLGLAEMQLAGTGSEAAALVTRGRRRRCAPWASSAS